MPTPHAITHVIGIDIGGSSAKLGLVDTAAATILARETVTSGFDVHATEFLGALRTAIARLSAHGEPQALGVGMPGLQDSQGRVRDASNLPGLNGIAIASELASPHGWPSRMDNDLNVLALGEARYGDYRASRLLVVALGTGIGAAMTVDGEVLRPTPAGLGDPGHILVDANGAECRCGARGCLETKVSGWAIAEGASLANVPYWLGMGLASFCVLYEPDAIVLGGKISVAGGAAFLEATGQRMRELCQARFRPVPLTISRLGDDAGILGAAAMMAR